MVLLAVILAMLLINRAWSFKKAAKGAENTGFRLIIQGMDVKLRTLCGPTGPAAP